MEPPAISVSFSPDEVLVLFEFLSRFSDNELPTIEDQAESRALWNLCCELERQLAEPFDANYQEQLAAARARLRDEPMQSDEPAES